MNDDFEFTPHMLNQITRAVAKSNEDSRQYKAGNDMLDNFRINIESFIDQQVQINRDNQEINKKNSESLLYIKKCVKTIVPREQIKELIDVAILKYDNVKLKNELEDTKEHSQSIALNNLNTPMSGVPAVKSEDEKIPYHKKVGIVGTAIGGGVLVVGTLLMKFFGWIGK